MREKNNLGPGISSKLRWLLLSVISGVVIATALLIYHRQSNLKKAKPAETETIVEKFQTWLQNPAEGTLFEELERTLPKRSDHRACLYLHQAQQAVAKQGDLKRAHELLRQAESAAVDSGLAALVTVRLIRIERGLGSLDSALKRAQQLKTPGYEGWSLLLQALIQEDQGAVSSARELYKQAILKKSLTTYLQEFCEMKLASLVIQTESSQVSAASVPETQDAS